MKKKGQIMEITTYSQALENTRTMFPEVAAVLAGERLITEPGTDGGTDDQHIAWAVNQILAETVSLSRAMVEAMEAHLRGSLVTTRLAHIVAVEARLSVAYALASQIDFGLRRNDSLEEIAASVRKMVIERLVSSGTPTSTGMVDNLSTIENADAWRTAARRLGVGF